MVHVIINLQVRLASPEVNTDTASEAVNKILTDAEAIVKETKVEPLAFGLKQLVITFTRDEDKGSTDAIEEHIEALDDVAGVQVIGVSRALG